MSGNSLIQQLAPLRQRIANACDEFLANGGQIEQFDILIRPPVKKSQGGSPKARDSLHKRDSQSLRRRDSELAEQAKTLVTEGQSAEAIRKRFGLNRDDFEQFAARHGIHFE